MTYGTWVLDWKGYYDGNGLDEQFILDGLQTGVVGGAVYCDENLWYSYSSGIMTYDRCKPRDENSKAITEINHAIQIVGHGIEVYTKTRYWIIANTWSTMWGENGYIKLERVDKNDASKKLGTCNINEYIVYSWGT